jgi:hypothetical protein
LPSRWPVPTDHGYRVAGLKYEDCWDSPGYSQGASGPKPCRSAPSPALAGRGSALRLALRPWPHAQSPDLNRARSTLRHLVRIRARALRHVRGIGRHAARYRRVELGRARGGCAGGAGGLRRNLCHLSRLRGRSTRSQERGGWGNSFRWRRCMRRHPHPGPPPQASGRGGCSARRLGTCALLLQKPPRGDPRQMHDRPVVDVGPGFGHLTVHRHRQHLPDIFGGLGKALAAGFVHVELAQ